MNIKKLFSVIYCLFGIISISFAWRPSTRCDKNIVSKRSTSVETGVLVADNITRIATDQNKHLIETYKDFKFVGVPVRAVSRDQAFFFWYKIEVPQNCTFITHPPSLLSDVDCHEGVACKLSYSDSMTKTYTSSDGFNWGAKLSLKFSLFEKLLEVGGEASYGQTYTCTLTEAKTTTHIVDCSVPSGSLKKLQLFKIQSDVKCWIGQVTMYGEVRNDRHVASISRESIGLDDLSTFKEWKQISLEDSIYFMIVDMDKIPEYLLRKLKKLVPEYNPYTDLISLREPERIAIFFFGRPIMHDGYDKIIPFTNEQGNAVYQYSCSTA